MRWAGTGIFPSLPIAKRVEAALRVAENPNPFALRLARRLRAAARLGRRMDPPPVRLRKLNARHSPCDWASDEADVQLCALASGFVDTS
jgi:hypothetical protein